MCKPTRHTKHRHAEIVVWVYRTSYIERRRKWDVKVWSFHHKRSEGLLRLEAYCPGKLLKPLTPLADPSSCHGARKVPLSVPIWLALSRLGPAWA